jgi:hypothetical protein
MRCAGTQTTTVLLNTGVQTEENYFPPSLSPKTPRKVSEKNFKKKLINKIDK